MIPEGLFTRGLLIYELLIGGSFFYPYSWVPWGFPRVFKKKS